MELESEKRLGGFVFGVGILIILGKLIQIVFGLLLLFRGNQLNVFLQKLGEKNIFYTFSNQELTIMVCLAALAIIGIGLILCRNKQGLLLYYGTLMVSYGLDIADHGFKISMLASWILPIVLGVSLYLKRDAFKTKKLQIGV